MNISSNFVKIKSKNPKKAAVSIERKIITTVKCTVCFVVGQLTCFNSPFVLLRYSMRLIYFAKDLTGLRKLSSFLGKFKIPYFS